MNNDILVWLHDLQRRSAPADVLAISNETSVSLLIGEITNDINLFRLSLISEIGQSRKMATSVLSAIVQTSNALHSFLLRHEESSLPSLENQEVCRFYVDVLDLLESLSDWVEELLSVVNRKLLDVLPVSNYKHSRLKLEFSTGLRVLTVYLNKSTIDPQLAALLLDEFNLLITKTWVSVASVRYIAAFSRAFASGKPKTTMELVFFLYRYNFNSSVFLSYCFMHCSDIIASEPGLYEQLDVLCRIEDRINILSSGSTDQWCRTNPSIDEQISKYIDKKKRFLHHQLKFRRVVLRAPSIGETSGRMRLNLSVAQLALFIRLFIIVGVIPNEDIGKIFAFFARHFYTKNAQFISSDSLQRKSTDVELSTAKKLKSILISKVNWLNKTFNG
ncbi:hypothetical protein HP439_04465 [Sphingobacterium shayense]|uniref:hypothetical protein n=1 Tax=Sphingobacterium shayense TaxID=626343 RepID=UPI0015561260|nr:hypothetical protein [Sphingobacterium shayense]NQD69974.1 hypothetical protein [Sphingobacterium shayense]